MIAIGSKSIAEIRAEEPVPFLSVDRCPACGLLARFRFDYHGSNCVSDGDGGYLGVNTTGEAERPHLHIRCGNCGFTFKMQVAAP